MCTTITINRELNKQTEKLITFKNIPTVYEFFKTRGFVKHQDKPVNYLNLVMLKHNLKKQIEEAQRKNDTETLDKLRPAYEELNLVLTRKTTKLDKLSIAFES